MTYRSNEAEAQNVVSEIEQIGGKAIALQLDTSNTKTSDNAQRIKVSGSMFL